MRFLSLKKFNKNNSKTNKNNWMRNRKNRFKIIKIKMSKYNKNLIN